MTEHRTAAAEVVDELIPKSQRVSDALTKLEVDLHDFRTLLDRDLGNAGAEYSRQITACRQQLFEAKALLDRLFLKPTADEVQSFCEGYRATISDLKKTVTRLDVADDNKADRILWLKARVHTLDVHLEEAKVTIPELKEHIDHFKSYFDGDCLEKEPPAANGRYSAEQYDRLHARATSLFELLPPVRKGYVRKLDVIVQRLDNLGKFYDESTMCFDGETRLSADLSGMGVTNDDQVTEP